MAQPQKTNRRKEGNEFEEMAIEFLLKNNFEILFRNYYFNRGEIDIIAKEGSTLIFIEVKARRSNAFGTPEEAITPKKQNTLRRTADGFILEHPEITFLESRFDVIAIERINGNTEIRHLTDAF